jgi:hypothetical protein
MEYFRKYYQPYPYTIPNINLSFQLDEAKTTVVRSYGVTVSTVIESADFPCKVIKRKTLIGEVSVGKDLQLLGEDLQLVEVAVDGRVLSSSEFIVSSEALTKYLQCSVLQCLMRSAQ